MRPLNNPKSPRQPLYRAFFSEFAWMSVLYMALIAINRRMASIAGLL
jgi:hypothetical protein